MLSSLQKSLQMSLFRRRLGTRAAFEVLASVTGAEGASMQGCVLPSLGKGSEGGGCHEQMAQCSCSPGAPVPGVAQDGWHQA